MTGLDTQVDDLISRMNPAFSSLCSSDAIAFLLGFFFEAFMTVGKAPTASLLPKTKGGYKRMYMG
jgi:hypothetical protein